MKFLDLSFVCYGFQMDFEFVDECIVKYYIIIEDYNILEERVFFIWCEILINFVGICCSKCLEEKKCFDRKIGRRMLVKDKLLFLIVNY